MSWTKVDDAWEEVADLFSIKGSMHHNTHVNQKEPSLDVSLLIEEENGGAVVGKRSGKAISTRQRVTLRIQQDRTALGNLGTTGSVVWDSGVIAARIFVNAEYLSGSDILNVRGRKLRVELSEKLGAGTGIVSLGVAASGASQVIVTDQLNVVKLAQKNFKANSEDLKSPTYVEFVELLWGDEESYHIFDSLKPEDASQDPPSLDFIIASDCVYNDSIVPALVTTLHSLTKSSDSRKRIGSPARQPALARSDEPAPPEMATKVVIIQELRAEEVHALLLEMMIAKGFEIWRVPSEWIAKVSNESRTSSCIAYIAWLSDCRNHFS
ncbi:hypothetical protein HDU67_008337 [Dinochytrium kinnereticum]|nr:hypothetical protein HDU67_008337 [Dinochytrium kinnereticum]